jgi:hypothetical protein
MANTLPLAEGAAVRLADREPNAADNKSGLFYPYYRNLTGTVAKLYADGTATITVDSESLPPEIRARHQSGTDAMRQKWLDGLSDEARNKLSAAEKKFSLRYNLLIGVPDLTPISPPALAAPAPAELEAPEPARTAIRGQAIAPQTSLEMDDLPETPRKSTSDLAEAEAKYLTEISQKKEA